MKPDTHATARFVSHLPPLILALIMAGFALVTLFASLKASPAATQGSSLVVSPTSLASTQSADSLVTKTLILTNTSVNSLVWRTGGGDSITYDNGPLVNLPGGAINGADGNVLQEAGLGMTSLGYGNSVFNNNRLADEFTINDADGWQLENITFYAYQTGSPLNSSMTAVNFRIWDGPPDLPTSTVIFGDTTTDRLIDTVWSGVYRVSDLSALNPERPIMANTAAADIFLPAGTYWLDWQTDGTLSSGPWSPPIVISNVVTTGNGLQLTSSGSWVPLTDSGTDSPQGFPFHIEASLGQCDLPTWLNVNPISGTLAAGTADQIAVTFDSTGLAAGTYTSELCIASEEPDTPFIYVPVTLTNLVPAITFTATVGISPDSCAAQDTLYSAEPVNVYYCYKIRNNGNLSLTLHDLTDTEFGSIFSDYSLPLAPGEVLSTVNTSLILSKTIAATTYNTATWTAYNEGPSDVISATESTAVIIATPDIILTATVGTDPQSCASDSQLTTPIGTKVYYCYRVTNNGAIPLDVHDLSDTLFGDILTTYTQTIEPSSSFNTVAAGITLTTQIMTHTTNTAVWTAHNYPLIHVSDKATANTIAVRIYPVYLPSLTRP